MGGGLIIDRPADGVARVTLSRPKVRNAMDFELLDQIASAMQGLDEGIGTRCVVITGEGTAFSAGYDMTTIDDDDFERNAEALLAHPFTAALDAVANHPWPVIAAINGPALGGGLELALCCDVRLCVRDAKLGMPPAKLGLVYGHIGLRRIIEAVGVARTRQMFITGRNVSGERAEQIGLVHEVYDDAAGVERESLELASEIAANAPLSMRGNKQAIGILADIIAGFDRLTAKQERELMELRASSFTSEDLHEGVRAFVEKRQPEWHGR